MQWIETWLGVSPDGGDGSLEALLVAAGAVSVAMLVAALDGPARRRLTRLLPDATTKRAVR